MTVLRLAGALLAAGLLAAGPASAADYTFPNQLPGTRLTVCGVVKGAPWVYPTTPKATTGSDDTYGVTRSFTCAKAAPLVRAITARLWDTGVSNAMLKGQPAGYQCFVSTDARRHVWGGNCTNGPVGAKAGFGWIFGKR